MDYSSFNSTFRKPTDIIESGERPFRFSSMTGDNEYDVPKMITDDAHTSLPETKSSNLSPACVTIKINDTTETNHEKHHEISTNNYGEVESPVFGKTFGKHLHLEPHPIVGKKHSKSAGDLKTKHGIDKEIMANNGNLYLNVNDYQTFFGVHLGGSNGSSLNSVEDGAVPANSDKQVVRKKKDVLKMDDYDEETLKALRRVTRKFDSFRMRQLRAKCFNMSDSLDEIPESGDAKTDKKCNNDEEDAKLLNVLKRGHTDKKCTDFNRVSYAASQLLSNRAQKSKSGIVDNKNNPDDETNENSKETLSIPKKSTLTLNGEEIDRVEFFYSSLGCETYVANCVVDVLMSVRTGTLNDGDNSPYRWVQVWVGVPILILDVGIESRRPRKLTLALAERATGIPLWQERVTYNTDYRQTDEGRSHLLNETSGQSRTLKIRWSDTAAADKFFSRYKLLTKDPKDALWLTPKNTSVNGDAGKNKKSTKSPPISPFSGQKKLNSQSSKDTDPVTKSYRKMSMDKDKKSTERTVPRKRIQKQDISNPFHVKVVTKVDGRDSNFKTTFAGLLPVKNKNVAVNKANTVLKKKKENDVDEDNEINDFRPRLPTN